MRLIIYILILWSGFGVFNSCSPHPSNSIDHAQTVQDTNVSVDYARKLKIVAMVNSDTIINKYEYALLLRDNLTQKSIQFENILRKKEIQLRNDVSQFQRDAPTLTQFEGKNREQKLIKLQEKLQKEQEDYGRQMITMEQGYNRDIHNAINAYLEIYCADKPYEMVLSNSDLGIIRWADKDLDITQEVLQGLNEEYASKHHKSNLKPSVK